MKTTSSVEFLKTMFSGSSLEVAIETFELTIYSYSQSNEFKSGQLTPYDLNKFATIMATTAGSLHKAVN